MPQRRAAVKATANLKDADKPMTKKEEELVLFGEPESKKKKEAEEKAAKKKALEPLWKRYIHILIFCFDLKFSFLWLLSVAFPKIKQLLKVTWPVTI